MEEHDDVYKHFGDVAKQEGFDHIAMIFHSIAAIEKTHGNRFGHYASLMEKRPALASEEEEEWMCLNCRSHSPWKQRLKNARYASMNKVILSVRVC